MKYGIGCYVKLKKEIAGANSLDIDKIYQIVEVNTFSQSYKLVSIKDFTDELAVFGENLILMYDPSSSIMSMKNYTKDFKKGDIVSFYEPEKFPLILEDIVKKENKFTVIEVNGDLYSIKAGNFICNEINADDIFLVEREENNDNECITSVKNDVIDDKLRWDLLPLQEIEEIVKVYHAGAKKYGPNRWQNLEDGYNRYKAAMMRHLLEYEKGERYDKDTGCMHLAQVGWNAIALLYLDKHGKGLIEKENDQRI